MKVVSLDFEDTWIVADAQARQDGHWLLLVNPRNRRAWIKDPTVGVVELGDTLTGVASTRGDGSLDVFVTGMWAGNWPAPSHATSAG
ncbi:MAG: hypothetical protein ACHREM_31730 [Polyangiales bacterium]